MNIQLRDRLLSRIEERSAVVGVVGLGYVGLPLLIEFARAGMRVIGFDVDPEKTRLLNQGDSYIRHIPSGHVREVFGAGETNAATTDFARVADCDALLICVPTPLTDHRDPDLSYVENTARMLAPNLRQGQLVTLESTTYPGTTDELLVPILEQGSDLKSGVDFFVAYSPEREDPNNPEFSTRTIPKVVGGMDAASLEVAQALYGCVMDRVVPVSSCRAAEATKLMENIFRSVNIALVNELKVVFTAMGIDIWEVVNAAKTKPFGFMPFYPGPGLGGHCIPIDPFYLTWKAREYGVVTRFIELAGEINTAMPKYVVQCTMEALNTQGLALRGARILLVGLAYKKNVDDDRESPTYALWELLLAHGAEVDYFDPFCPHVPKTRAHGKLAGIESRRWDAIRDAGYTAAIISTAHDSVDHDVLATWMPLVIDTRAACAAAGNVIRA